MKLFSSILLLLLFLFPSCDKLVVEKEPLFIMRYADNQNKDYPTLKAAHYFASLVKARTNGDIEIEVYPSGLLGTEAETLEQLQFGGVDISRFSLSSLTKLLPELSVLQLPYLYKDRDHMWRVLDGEIGKHFMKEIKLKGLVGLCWFDAGARSFYTTEQIKNAKDLEGKRIRVQESDLMAALIDSIGANAYQIPFDDIYPALKQDKIDGAENNFPSYMSMEHYQEAKYYYLDEHFRIPEVVLMSENAKAKIEEINPEYMDIILECAKETSRYERKIWLTSAEEMYVKALKEGCIITFPSEEDIKYLKEKMSPIYEKLDANSKTIVQMIKNLM